MADQVGHDGEGVIRRRERMLQKTLFLVKFAGLNGICYGYKESCGVCSGLEGQG